MRSLQHAVSIALGIVSIFLLASCGSGNREFVLESIPERPTLSGWPERLHQRIESAELQAMSGGNPVESLVKLARLYHANGFYEEASQCYQGLITLQSKEAKWPHMLAEILSSYGKLEDALPYRELVMKLDPEYIPAMVRLGDVYLKQNKANEAEKVYTRVLKQDRDNPYAQLGLARLDIASGDLENAQQRLEAATRKTSLRIGSDLLATVYEKRGLNSLAAAIRGRAKSSGTFTDIPDTWLFEIYFESFNTYQMAVAAGMADQSGDSAACIRLLNQAIQLSPRDAYLHFQLGLVYLRIGIDYQALKSFEETAKLDPKFSDAWFQLAQLKSKEGDIVAATQTIATGLYHNPDSPSLRLVNSERLNAIGDLSGSIKEAETAIELRPEEADSYASLAALYFSSEQTAIGVELMKKALERESLHPFALSTMAFYSISTGQEKDARQYIRKARLQPRLPVGDLKHLETSFRQKFGKMP